MVVVSIAVLLSIGLISSILKHIIDSQRRAPVATLTLGSYTHSYPIATLSLIVEGTQLTFPWSAQSGQVVRTAVDFCSQNGEQFGFTLRTSPDCVDQIVEAIQTLQAAGSDISTWMLEFKRPKDGSSSSALILEAQQVQFEDNSSSDTSMAPALMSKLPINEEDLAQIILEINGANYLFEVNRVLGDSLEAMQARATAANRLSVDFCRLRAIDFGIIPKEEADILHADIIPEDHIVHKKCIEPLYDALIVRLDSKTIAAPKLKRETPLIEAIKEVEVMDALSEMV